MSYRTSRSFERHNDPRNAYNGFETSPRPPWFNRLFETKLPTPGEERAMMEREYKAGGERLC